MNEKSHLVSKRTVQGMSRPAIFVNKSQKKNKLDQQRKPKGNVLHK